MGRDPPKGPTLRGVFLGNGNVQVFGVSCFRMKIMCCTQTAESSFWCCSVGSLEDRKCIRRLGLDRLEARIVSASSASIQKAIGGSDVCSNGCSNIARIPVRYSLNLCLQCVPARCQASSCNVLKESRVRWRSRASVTALSEKAWFRAGEMSDVVSSSGRGCRDNFKASGHWSGVFTNLGALNPAWPGGFHKLGRMLA